MITKIIIHFKCENCGKAGIGSGFYKFEKLELLLPNQWKYKTEDRDSCLCFYCGDNFNMDFYPTRVIPKPSAKDLQRFIIKIDKTGGEDACWIFGKGKTYGSFALNSSRYRASRVSYEWLGGKEIPQDMFICHTCDNRACVNPKHLFPGSNSENIQDRVNKGRSYIPKAGFGTDNHQSKYNKEVIERIFKLRKDKFKIKDIAECMGIGAGYVSKILLGYVRSEDKPPDFEFYRTNKKQRKSYTRYSEEKVAKVKELLALNWAKVRIAKKVDCESWFVYDVVNRIKLEKLEIDIATKQNKHTMLEIQNYLQNYDSHNLESGLAALEETYGIFFRCHKEYPNLYLFKYNQIKSPMGEESND